MRFLDKNIRRDSSLMVVCQAKTGKVKLPECERLAE